MRIVTRGEFYKLPEGTVCSKYKPCIFGEPFVLLQAWFHENDEPLDFLYKDLFGEVDAYDSGEEIDILYSAEETGESFKMDFDCGMRDGLFDPEQKFAIWEEEDLVGLLQNVQQALDVVRQGK